MKRYILAVMLCLTAFPITCDAGKFRDFCAKYILADDPYEGEETIQEARKRYKDPTELSDFLRGLYYIEVNRRRPRESVVKAIEQFFGGKP